MYSAEAILCQTRMVWLTLFQAEPGQISYAITQRDSIIGGPETAIIL